MPKITMTLQDFCDTGIRQVFKQGGPAIRPKDGLRTRCLLRAPNGCRCLVGAVIPDDRYNHTWEYYSALDVLKAAKIDVTQGGVSLIGDPHHDGVLREWQDCHDGAATTLEDKPDLHAFMIAFKGRANNFLRVRDMSTQVLDECWSEYIRNKREELHTWMVQP